MPPPLAASPFSFLSALSGDREVDCEVIRDTRAHELQVCGHMALASKVATVYAFSGNGKSSLIQAGLIPFFMELGYGVFKTRPRPPFSLSDPTVAFKECCIRESWIPAAAAQDVDAVAEARRQLGRRPQGDLPAVHRLIEQLEAQVSRLSVTATSRSLDLRTYLRRHQDLSLSSFLEAAQQFLGNVPMIVICDQFEEIFVHFYNTPALDRFIDELRQACDNPALRVHFLFSMREDWVGSMILFRDAIPDIFNSTYRLSPMRHSKAAPAFALPLAKAGIEVDPQTTTRVLDDLAAFYRQQQTSDNTGIHLMPSGEKDPFIELPALQVVADRLWKTQKEHAAPFTLEHYAAMMPKEAVAQSGSPAAAVLDGYLSEILDRFADDDGPDAQAIKDLRLDILYLLTDKIAHRKALELTELQAQLKALRGAYGEAVALSRAKVVEATRALLEVRVLREETASSGDTRYELAHDFVV